MNHSEAIQQMIAERYLLDELTPEVREAFEEHLFDCPECALDLRAGATFLKVAKIQLPELTGAVTTRFSSSKTKSRKQRTVWFSLLQPTITVPVFASLVLLIGYQNLVTYPGLRAAAHQPRLLPWTPLHGATRGGLGITVDRQQGVALPIDLPVQPSPGAYVSYRFDLYDPQGKLVWTGVEPASGDSDSQRLSLMIPGAMLRNGLYSLAISGAGTHGEQIQIDRYIFDFHLTN
jgi:hypothetical protein